MLIHYKEVVPKSVLTILEPIIKYLIEHYQIDLIYIAATHMLIYLKSSYESLCAESYLISTIDKGTRTREADLSDGYIITAHYNFETKE